MDARYALYCAPDPTGSLWRLGSAVLGYDAASGLATAFPPGPPFDSSEWPDLTAEPRRYGFHGTLKAPFSLAGGTTEDGLIEAVRTFAQGREPFAAGPLEVAPLGSFVALVPGTPAPALDRLAADCVRAFEPFRAPLSVADRARRLAAPLSERQRRNLDAWGYPFVFDDFRFHMTLTGRLPEERREEVRAALARSFRDVPAGLTVDAVSVFRQDDRSGGFRVIERCGFGRFPLSDGAPGTPPP